MQRRSITEWLSLLARGIVRVAAIASNVCLIGMLVIIFANVILRYVVARPLYWGDEVMINLMIIMVYSGFAFVLSEGGHIRVTVVFNRLPGKVQNVLWIILSLLGASYTSFLLYAVIVLVLDSLHLESFSQVTRWPIAPWQIVIALGLFSLLVAFVMLVIARIGIALGVSKEKEAEKEVVELKD